MAISPTNEPYNTYPFIYEKQVVCNMFGNMYPFLAHWNDLDTVTFWDKEQNENWEKNDLGGYRSRSEFVMKKYYNSINTILFETNIIDSNQENYLIFHFSASTSSESYPILHNALLICCKLTGKSKYHGYYIFTKGRGNEIKVNNYDTVITNLDKTSLKKVFPHLGGHIIIKKGKISFPDQNWVTFEADGINYFNKLYFGNELFWSYFDFFRSATFPTM
jgi:hypothetical protein